MCFGIPMQIQAIDGLIAHCQAKGVERDVSLLMLMHEELAPGDYVVVYLGRAIERMSAEAAASAWALYDDMLAALETAPPEPLAGSARLPSGDRP